MTTKRFTLKNIAPVISGLLFLAALFVLHHTIQGHHYHDVLNALSAIPHERLLLAFLFTIAGYLTLTCYDFLAFLYIRQRLPYPKIAMTSFIGYAFSNNIGISFLSGGSVRYRLYSGWALQPFDIARIVVFCTFTGWLGFFGLGGVALLVEPSSLLGALPVPPLALRGAGLVLVALVAAYFLASLLKLKPFRYHDVKFRFPPWWLAGLQLLVACIDLALAAGVLYMVLPAGSGISYVSFLGIYLIALTSGLLSQVPGGVGVFETVILVLLSPRIPASHILGSLLAYRGIYYLVPLATAVATLGAYELHERQAHVRKFAHAVGLVFPAVVPRLFAFTTFVGGVILLFSGATPAVHTRLAFLRDLLPLPVVEVSHFLASCAGVGLLLLARGLDRRLDASYVISLILLALGVVFSLLKGFDYEEALILSVMLLALAPCHSYFYRKASLTDEKFSFGWVASIIVVIACSAWLGYFSHRHVEYSSSLWWSFSFRGGAPRVLRASVGVVVVALTFAAARLMRPSRRPPGVPESAELDAAAAIIGKEENTAANLALLGDKSILFNPGNTAFIMYGVEGRSWVALGDPVGPEDDLEELVWQFYELCDDNDAWPVFYLVQSECLPLYLDLGHNLLKLGEEARVPLAGFSTAGNDNKDRRHTLNKIEREGYVFDLRPASDVPALLPQLRRVSGQWLEQKNTREKGFSLGFFNEDYLARFPLALVRKNDSIVAFANVWPGANKRELSLDLMRYAPDAPDSVMEYLFLRLMLWGKEDGYEWFNLGMAPLSGLENRALAPLWHRVGSLVFRYGEHFYNFQGLRQYKEKFNPVWRPRYLAFPGGLSLPIILSNIASLISGGLKGVVAK